MAIFRKFVLLGRLFITMSLFIAVGCESKIDSDVEHNDSNDDSDDDSDSDGDSDSDSDTDSSSAGDSETTIPSTCEIAANMFTSVGCEFYAVDMPNGTQFGTPYAIVISNPQKSKPATVTLEHGKSGIIYTKTIAAGTLDEILVAGGNEQYTCLVENQQLPNYEYLGLKSGFRIMSDVPIMAYQWNTMYAEEHTEDASLLFPIESLGTEYIAVAWGDEQDLGGDYKPAGYTSSSGTISIVFTEDNTEFSFSPWQMVRYDLVDDNDWRKVPAGEWSKKRIFNELDVLEFRSFEGWEDITGAKFIADKPIAVFGGHVCANIPELKFGTCDHVEEQTLPVSRWGTEAVLAGYGHRELCTNDDSAWHIIAGVDDMRVTFDPPAPAPFNAEYTISKQGEVIKFLSDKNYLVRGIKNNPTNSEDPNAPFQAVMGLPGHTYAGCIPLVVGDPAGLGDPLTINVPAAGQYLNRYVFTTDKELDYLFDIIIITRKVGTVVTLECFGEIPDSMFSKVGSSEWEVARFFIDDMENSNSCQDGINILTATAPVGLMVAGTSPAGSYGYLAGTGTKIINNVIIE